MTAITVPNLGTFDVTDARRRGLEVLIACEHTGRAARESNITDIVSGTVYWQTVEWLSRQNLVITNIDGGVLKLELTPGGRRLTEQLQGVRP